MTCRDGPAIPTYQPQVPPAGSSTLHQRPFAGPYGNSAVFRAIGG